ncbi:MAG: glycosyltransferase family protein [Promethearchaeota archaeon]
MKFLVSGNIWSKSQMEYYFIEELRNQGHEVIALDSRWIVGILRGLNFEDLEKEVNGVFRGKLFTGYYNTIKALVRDNSFDYFFSMNDKHLHPTVLKIIRKMGIWTIGFFGDLILKSDYYLHYKDCFDITLAPYEDPRFPKIQKWTWACVLPYIKKLDVEKDIDVLWYGSLYPNRRNALDYIIDKLNLEHDIYVTLYGYGFPNGEVWAEDLNRLINRAKVVLHIDHPDVRAPTLRFYEVLGTETELVTDTLYPSIYTPTKKISPIKVSLDRMVLTIKEILNKNTFTARDVFDHVKKINMEYRVKQFLAFLEDFE